MLFQRYQIQQCVHEYSDTQTLTQTQVELLTTFV